MTQKTRSARRTMRPATVLLVAAVLLAVAVVGYRTLLTPPMAELGKLPLPGAGLPPALSGAGGPGFTFEYSYRLGGSLPQGWPALPNQTVAYLLKAPQFTEAWVTSVATKLGITASVVREGWQEGYLLAADPGNEGPSLRMYPNGYITYIAPYDRAAAERAELPTDAQAIAEARGWLVASGMVAEGSQLDAGTVTEDLNIGLLIVDFHPAEPGDVVTLAPWAAVQVGRGGRVVVGSATWFPPQDSSPYPLRPVADAWEIVKRGDGTVSWQIREWPGPSDDSGVVRGEVEISSVRVAWSLATAADGKPYLVPCYAFEGQVEVPGPQGPESYPVTVWAPAVSAEYSIE